MRLCATVKVGVVAWWSRARAKCALAWTALFYFVGLRNVDKRTRAAGTFLWDGSWGALPGISPDGVGRTGKSGRTCGRAFNDKLIIYLHLYMRVYVYI